MHHQAHVFFAVSKFGQDAIAVTEILGFEPTEFWIVGQPTRKRPDIIHKFSRWTFKSPLSLNSSIEEHLEALLSILELHAPGITKVNSRYTAHIGCGVYSDTFTQSFQLPQQLLARVAALGLGLDFDLYHLGDAEES